MKRNLLVTCAFVLVACTGTTESDPDESSASNVVNGADAATTAKDASSADASANNSMPSADAGSDDDAASSEDVGPPPNELVPIFVATGDLGRTTISCDDGRTWIANRSYELEGDPLVCGNTDPVRCYDTGCEILNRDTCETQADNCDCNHHPGAPQGVTWGDGWFMATWGWGPPGSVKRSQNGIDWEVVTEGTTYGGIAYGDGAFVAGARTPGVTYDNGETWEEPARADLRSPDGSAVYNVRKFGFADGVFVIAAASGSNRSVMVSRDRGATWVAPDQLDPACAERTSDIAGGGGTIVITHRDGLLCVSDDQGATFEAVQTEHDFGSTVLFVDGEFVAWGGGERLTSPDGRTWTATPTEGGDQLGPIAHNPETGTFVAFNGGWKRWYDQQRAYRSTDGINWTELGEADAERSHKIDYIAFGWAPAETCD